MKKKEKKFDSHAILFNKRAHHEYSVIKKLEAGIVLQGWEVKSIRAGRVNISNGYVIFKNGEAFLIGVNLTPLSTTFSAHHVCDPTRVRKLLLNRYELRSLCGYIHHKGYTVIILSLYRKNTWCKATIAIAKGKKQEDKRYDLKNREWNINKARIIKNTRR